MPTASNTGVPLGLALKPVWGDVTVTRAGTVLSGLDIHGFVKVRAANVTIRDSRIHGSGPGSSNTGLVDANSPSVRGLLIENCILSHDAASVWVDGVVGHDYTVLRSNVSNVVDGFGVMNPSNPAADLNVVIESNYVHDLDYMGNDPNHPDHHTHNDGVQIQGTGHTYGKVQVLISGNNLQALAGPASNIRSPYYPAVTGQAIAVTPNVSQVHDVVISGNWLNGGAQSITMIPGSKGVGSGMVMMNNRFGTIQGTHRPVLIQSPVSVYHLSNTYSNGKHVTISK
jgi:hypothetical protein